MDIIVTQETEQKDAHRKVIAGTLSYTQKATPSRQDVIQVVAKQFSAKPECIVVRSITPTFGASQSSIVIYIYENAESLAVMEPTYVAQKNKIKAQDKSSESEEKPAEDAEKTVQSEDKPTQNQEEVTQEQSDKTEDSTSQEQSAQSAKEKQ